MGLVEIDVLAGEVEGATMPFATSRDISSNDDMIAFGIGICHDVT